MWMIFEDDIEKEDFFEIILTRDDIENIQAIGIVQDFPKGLYGKRNLNVYIRMERKNEMRE